MVDSERPPAVPAAGGSPKDRADLRTDAWSPRPDEELRFFFFEGLLETTAGVRAELEAASFKLEGLALAEVKLDIDGRRARLMLEEGAWSGEKLDDKTRSRFLEALQEFLDAAADSRSAESTLRCTEVFVGSVRETLFRPIGGNLETVCRLRAKTPLDDARAPKGSDAPRGLAGFEWRTVIVLLTLLFVGFGASAWSSGWVDRVLAHDAGELAIERGAFEGLLEIKLAEHWGKYEVELRRGPNYPTDPALAQAALDAAKSSADRASVNAVVNGEDIFVVLESGAGRALAAERVSLRPLLSKADAQVEVKLWGQMLARKVRLSLDDGKQNSEAR